MNRQVRQAEPGQAALPGSQELAGAAQAQILLGDAKAVVGLAQDAQTRAVSPSGPW